jgi:hypothetical protein
MAEPAQEPNAGANTRVKLMICRTYATRVLPATQRALYCPSLLGASVAICHAVDHELQQVHPEPKHFSR